MLCFSTGGENSLFPPELAFLAVLTVDFTSVSSAALGANISLNYCNITAF